MHMADWAVGRSTSNVRHVAIGVFLSTVIATAACVPQFGDPVTTLWAKNESQNAFILRVQTADDQLPAVLINPGEEGIVSPAPVGNVRRLQVATPDCRVVADNSVDSDRVGVLIGRNGQIDLSDLSYPGPEVPAHEFAVAASCAWPTPPALNPTGG